MIQEFILEDYLKMQNEMYLSGMKGIPNTEVTCYGDEKQKIILHVWYDEIDVPLVERCKSNLFIKAYSENGREGVQTQTSPKIVFTDLGYGRDSTASLRRLIALYAKGWTLQYLEDKQLEIFPKNDNHLDLRRANLEVVKVNSYYGEDIRTGMPLAFGELM